MGFMEWADKQVPIAAENKARAACTGGFEGITLKPWTITHKGQTRPIAGAVARVESGSDIRRRVTATRAVAVGIFALAVRKQVGHVYLSVEGDGFEFMVEVPVKKEADARKFAARINSAGRHTS